MIKAIIFDCFGVLAKESWTPFRDEHFGTSGEDFEWANMQMQAVSKGKMTAQEFSQVVGERTGIDPGAFLQLIHNNPPNVELFDYIRNVLKTDFKIGFLSNVGANRLEELFAHEQMELIDELALSFDIGSAKPEPEAYLHIARKLGVATNECVFIDDIEKYCVGARAVGMQAILYRDFALFVRDLEELLAK